MLFALLTIISLRQIFVPESQECTSNNLWSIWGLFQLLFAILGPKTFKIVKSTSWCFVHFWPVHFWTSSVGGSGPEVYDRKIQGGGDEFYLFKKVNSQRNAHFYVRKSIFILLTQIRQEYQTNTYYVLHSQLSICDLGVNLTTIIMLLHNCMKTCRDARDVEEIYDLLEIFPALLNSKV